MFKGKFGIGRGYVSLINREHVSLSVQAVQVHSFALIIIIIIIIICNPWLACLVSEAPVTNHGP